MRACISLAQCLQVFPRQEGLSSISRRIFMKKLVESVFLGGALAAFLSVGLALSAQSTTPSQSTDSQQQPAPPPAQSPDTQATPDSQVPSTQTPSFSPSPPSLS